jgi:hypothetical protein
MRCIRLICTTVYVRPSTNLVSFTSHVFIKYFLTATKVLFVLLNKAWPSGKPTANANGPYATFGPVLLPKKYGKDLGEQCHLSAWKMAVVSTLTRTRACCIVLAKLNCGLTVLAVNSQRRNDSVVPPHITKILRSARYLKFRRIIFMAWCELSKYIEIRDPWGPLLFTPSAPSRRSSFYDELLQTWDRLFSCWKDLQ